MTNGSEISAYSMFLGRRLYSASPVEREAFAHDDQYTQALLDLMSEQIDGVSPSQSDGLPMRRDTRAKMHAHDVPVFDSRDEMREGLLGIDRLITPLQVKDFYTDQYKERTPVLFKGPANRFEELLDLQELNQLIYSRDPIGNQLVLVHHGKRIDPDLYSFNDPGTSYRLPELSTSRVDGRKLQNFLRLGATLILNGINLTHEKVRLLVEEISRSMQVYAHANLYATWKPSQGFDSHWDNHDVFIVHLNGAKEWRLFGESRVSPTPLDEKPNLESPSEEIWVGELTSGDVLYIPRGWWHEASTTEDNQGKASVHLTVSFRPITGLNFLLWLEKLLLRHEQFRVNVPALASDEARKSYFDKLRTLIENELDRDLEVDFLSDLKQAWISNSATSVSEYVEPWDDPSWETYLLRLETAPDWSPVLLQDERAFHIVANAVEYKIDAHAFGLVKSWADNQPIKVAELREIVGGEYSSSFLDDFVKQMVRNRLATATKN